MDEAALDRLGLAEDHGCITSTRKKAREAQVTKANDKMANGQSILLRRATLLVHDENNDVNVLLNTDVLIEGDTIARVVKGIKAPPLARTVDCSGGIISPGLIDTHRYV